MPSVTLEQAAPDLAGIIEDLEALVLPTRDLRGDTRERILDSAIQLFADEGFAATTVRRISSSVGITGAGLYSHFESKEEIMGVSLAHSYLTFLRFVFVEGRSLDEQPGIIDICRRHMEFQLTYRAMSSASDQLLAKYMADQYVHADTLAIIRRAQRVYFTRVRNAVAEVRGSSPLDASLEAEAVLSLCDSVSSGPRVKPARDPEDLVESYLILIRRMLKIPE